MRIFKVKGFARKEDLTDAALSQAVSEIELGLIDANLGGELVKKRIGEKGRGKRGGYRTIVAVRSECRAFFLYCFAKTKKSNITERELSALKKLASELMSYSTEQLETALEAGALEEVKNNGKGTSRYPGLGP